MNLELSSQRTPEYSELLRQSMDRTRATWVGWKDDVPPLLLDIPPELDTPPIPRKILFRLFDHRLKGKQFRPYWDLTIPPAGTWMNESRHRWFVCRMMAQFALANGVSERQTWAMILIWSVIHETGWVDAQVREIYNEAFDKTEAYRTILAKNKKEREQSKTAYRIKQWLIENGPATPAEVAVATGMRNISARLPGMRTRFDFPGIAKKNRLAWINGL